MHTHLCLHEQKREFDEELSANPDQKRKDLFDQFMQYSYRTYSDTFGVVLWNIPTTIERLLAMFSVKEFMDGVCIPRCSLSNKARQVNHGVRTGPLIGH